MADPAIPDVPAGRLGRHAKLSLTGFVLLGAIPLGCILVDQPLTPGVLALAALFAAGVAAARGWRALRTPAPAVRLAGAFALSVAVAPLLLGLQDRAFAPAEALVFGLGYAACYWSALAMVGILWRTWLLQAGPRGTTLSVAIICKDEVDRIGRLLEAVHGWADQVVVLDSGSTDGTVELARRYTDEVIVTDWPGYGVQKQRALERCRGEWVLSLDADEVPSADLKREVDAWLAARTDHHGFKAHWVSVVFGGPVDFGADGRYHTRLLRRSSARFDGATVHEEAVVGGPVATLESPVFHLTFRDDAHMDAKFDEYARLSAAARYAKGRRATRAGALARGAASFLLLYLVRLGLLDGRRGLRMAARYARYTYDKYAGLVALAEAARR